MAVENNRPMGLDTVSCGELFVVNTVRIRGGSINRLTGVAGYEQVSVMPVQMFRYISILFNFFLFYICKHK